MNIDDIIENARLKGRVIALEAEVQTLQAEVRCLEAVIRSHERVDCLIVANLKAELQRLRASSFTTAVPSEDYEKLKAELAKSEEHNAALCERLQDLNSVVFTTSCTNAGLHSQFANSEQENARLKAEVERLEPELEQRCRELNLSLAQQAIQLRQIGELKAEVECLSAADSYLQNANEYAYEKRCDELEAEVERLRKAGDVLESGLRTLPGDFPRCLANEWTAAKEGKQS